MIEMKVAGLTLDPLTNTPIIILKDLEDRRAIPIWIGLYEATAIATEMEHIAFTRPMTHDLIKDILHVLEVLVEKVEIIDIRNNTFFANIHLSKGGRNIVVDSRPSDAIALALRVDVPIFVDEKVIDKSRNVDFGLKGEELDKFKKEQLQEFLENLSAEDFGKYKM